MYILYRYVLYNIHPQLINLKPYLSQIQIVSLNQNSSYYSRTI